MGKEKRKCENCSYSRLNPCPFLAKCGPDYGFVKWAEKKEIIMKPPPEDNLEKEVRETMILRKEAERPLTQLKVTVFIVLVTLGFLAIFIFKFMRFMSHTFFAVVVVGILLVVLWGMINRKKKHR